jgi:hypothetical protein
MVRKRGVRGRGVGAYGVGARGVRDAVMRLTGVQIDDGIAETRVMTRKTTTTYAALLPRRIKGGVGWPEWHAGCSHTNRINL